jgi:putative hydrolase of the HAD superfamily
MLRAHLKENVLQSSSFLPPSIKAVFFDAVGTLIHPEPSAPQVYAEVSRRYGSRLAAAEIGRRFRRFFQIEEEADVRANWTTSEQREQLRWQRIVAGVLDDVTDAEGCFQVLYEHFSRPHAWRCDPAAERVLEELRTRGYRIGMASNYDKRLRSVVAGMPPLRFLEHLVISSEVGWRKPSRDFFAALCRTLNLPAEGVLFVGDDRGNDFDGAAQHGLAALLLDAAGKHMDVGTRRLTKLEELIR